jgi:hypothetical protein
MTCYPQLLYNFIYRKVNLATLFSMDTARSLCSRDLTIAQAFCRKFSWGELMLWPHDMPAASVVVLSGRDDLVPSELILQQFRVTGHKARMLHHPDLGHGGLLMKPEWMARVVGEVAGLVRSEGRGGEEGRVAMAE